MSTVQSAGIVETRYTKEAWKDQRRLTDRFRGDRVDVPLSKSAKSCKFLARFSVT